MTCIEHIDLYKYFIEKSYGHVYTLFVHSCFRVVYTTIVDRFGCLVSQQKKTSLTTSINLVPGFSTRPNRCVFSLCVGSRTRTNIKRRIYRNRQPPYGYLVYNNTLRNDLLSNSAGSIRENGVSTTAVPRPRGRRAECAGYATISPRSFPVPKTRTNIFIIFPPIKPCCHGPHEPCVQCNNLYLTDLTVL